MLRFYTAGESHGRALVGIIEGMPANLEISEDYINFHLSRRRQGYGRGARMSIESDQVQILAGVRGNRTLGSPISFLINNRDYDNWKEIMAANQAVPADAKSIRRPRPGHADLAGAMKYGHSDMRNVLERASARETAARVAAGAFFRKLLEVFNITIYSQVVAIGAVTASPAAVTGENAAQMVAAADQSEVRCLQPEAEKKMMQLIDTAKKAGESLGGSFEAGAVGVVPGLGSYVSWDKRLDADITRLLMSIPAIKAVEIGDGIENARLYGSQVHDEIHYNDARGLHRLTNHAGGIEGGISNGETIWARAYMKPIPTLYKPLVSVNTETWREEKADIERSDICAVPAAAVVGEGMLAYAIARALLEKFGGNNIEQTRTAFDSYSEYVKKVWKWQKI